MMMNAFWWEFIKMKVKLGLLRIIDLIWYRTMGAGVLLSNWWSLFEESGKVMFLFRKNSRLTQFVTRVEHFWWLRSRVGEQEVWLKLELFKNLWLLKKTYTRTCFIRNIFLAWSRNIDVKISTHFSLIWADTDAGHGSEGNQWADGEIWITSSSSLMFI